MINNLIILFAKLNAVVWILLTLFAILMAQADVYNSPYSETLIHIRDNVNYLHWISSILLIITIAMLK